MSPDEPTRRPGEGDPAPSSEEEILDLLRRAGLSTPAELDAETVERTDAAAAEALSAIVSGAADREGASPSATEYRPWRSRSGER